MKRLIIILLLLTSSLSSSPKVQLEKNISLGEFSSDCDKEISLVMKNEGNTELKVFDAHYDKSLMKLSWSETSIKPKTDTKLLITVKKSGQVGLFNKKILFRSNDPNNRLFSISLKGQLFRALTVTPSPFLHLKKGIINKPQKYELVITENIEGVKWGGPSLIKCANLDVSWKAGMEANQKVLMITVTPKFVSNNVDERINIPLISHPGYEPLVLHLSGKITDGLTYLQLRFFILFIMLTVILMFWYAYTKVVIFLT